MEIKKGDFVVIDQGKNVLVKVIAIEGKEFRALNQAMKRNTEGKYEKKLPTVFRKRDVVVNLGPSPRPGKVYGVKIEPLYRKEQSDDARFLFFVDYDDKLVARTVKAVSRAYADMKKARLNGIPAEIEVRNPEGKYSGWYHFLPRADHDVLCIKPNYEMMQPIDLDYVIKHEYGHGVWFRRLPSRVMARWVAAYDKHMALSSADAKDLDEVLAEVISAGGVRDFLRGADEETTQILKACLRHIRSVHGIDSKHLDLLILDGNDLTSYWPTYVQYSERNVMVSEYARKSPEELFAEAFAFKFTGKSLPKHIDKLMTMSLAKLKSVSAIREDDEETSTRDDSDAD